VHPHTLSERRRLYLLGRVLVARHYGRPLTLVAVARAIGTSPRQLQRAYAQFGDSFQEDLFARRMAAAAQLLAEQRAIPVSDVGRLVGYPHSSHFASSFRRRYGLSPARFRECALRHAATRTPTPAPTRTPTPTGADSATPGHAAGSHQPRPRPRPQHQHQPQPASPPLPPPGQTARPPAA
jgi:AraC-like DNA-binding protein